jgi:hypothetical protein
MQALQGVRANSLSSRTGNAFRENSEPGLAKQRIISVETATWRIRGGDVVCRQARSKNIGRSGSAPDIPLANWDGEAGTAGEEEQPDGGYPLGASAHETATNRRLPSRAIPGSSLLISTICYM